MLKTVERIEISQIDMGEGKVFCVGKCVKQPCITIEEQTASGNLEGLGAWENLVKVSSFWQWREERRPWSMEGTGKAVVGGMPPMGAWGSWG